MSHSTTVFLPLSYTLEIIEIIEKVGFPDASFIHANTLVIYTLYSLLWVSTLDGLVVYHVIRLKQ